jgi:hypothetical protein
LASPHVGSSLTCPTGCAWAGRAYQASIPRYRARMVKINIIIKSKILARLDSLFGCVCKIGKCLFLNTLFHKNAELLADFGLL